MQYIIPDAVLDTNVVLDWLVFKDARCTALGKALDARRLRWIATPPMREELAHVLGRRHLDAWHPDEEMLWRTWDRLALQVQPPLPTGRAAQFRCTDADDQKFIDLALSQATLLFSRDRAVLKLARRASSLGVQVLTPERWAERIEA